MRKPETPKKSQSEKFVEKARELGCDEDEAAFERTLKRIVPKQTKSGSKKDVKPNPKKGAHGV